MPSTSASTRCGRIWNVVHQVTKPQRPRRERVRRGAFAWSRPATSRPAPQARRCAGHSSLAWTARSASSFRVVSSGHFSASASKRGAAGVTVLVLDGAFGEQLSRGLVRPFLGQRLEARRCGGRRPCPGRRVRRGAFAWSRPAISRPAPRSAALRGPSSLSWTARSASSFRVISSGHFSASASKRGAAGTSVLILDDAFSEQLSRNLVRPSFRQSFDRVPAHFYYVVAGSELNQFFAVGTGRLQEMWPDIHSMSHLFDGINGSLAPLRANCHMNFALSNGRDDLE